MNKLMYTLPELNYSYDSLKPYISEELMKLHHDKHHTAYMKGANAILEKMDKAIVENTDFDAKATFKELSFNIGGHVLHSLFWGNLAPVNKGGGGKPSGTIAQAIDEEYGSYDHFKKIFSQTAISTEGSGWAALSYCLGTKRPIITQIEKHNTNVYPMFKILMVLDVWEHAYYIDYKNDRAKYVESFWNIVNWSEVGNRFDALLKK